MVGKRGARTRERILEIAERTFAEHGYAETRLEDISSRLEITRAALVYYFANKRALYECVLDGMFGELVARVALACEGVKSPGKRVEAMVDAWVSYAAERPTFVRVYLRELASAGVEQEPIIARHTEKLFEILSETLREGEQAGLFGSVDPMHLVSSFAGPTIFFLGVLPFGGIDPTFDPLSPERFQAHRADVLANVRRILRSGRPTKRPARPRRVR